MVDINIRAIPVLSAMVLTWIGLVILYFVLKKFLHEPVSKMMNDRKEKIQTNIDDANIMKEEAIALKAQYEDSISNAKEESQKILEASRRRGEELKQNIIDEANNEAELIKDRARRDIEREKSAALQGLQNEALEMGLLIASKLIEKEITIENQEDLMNKFIEEVGNSKWEN